MICTDMGVVAPPQGQPQGRDYEAEMEALRASYEQQLAQLKEEYGTEHSNRTKLEEEMALLRTNFEEQLALAQVHIHVHYIVHVHVICNVDIHAHVHTRKV